MQAVHGWHVSRECRCDELLAVCPRSVFGPNQLKLGDCGLHGRRGRLLLIGTGLQADILVAPQPGGEETLNVAAAAAMLSRANSDRLVSIIAQRAVSACSGPE